MSALGTAGVSLVFAFVWWLALSVIGGIGWLVLKPATNSWDDAGWALARPLALLALAYVVWVAAHLLPVFAPGPLRVIVAVCAIAAGLFAGRRDGWRWDRLALRRLLVTEWRFTLPFIFLLAMRGLSHDLIGLEKFMDFSLVNAVSRTQSMPPPDSWFAGEPINYYYFGHYLAAFVSKLTGVPTAYGFNLMLATIFGAVFQLAYTLVAEMTHLLIVPVRRSIALVAGVWITLGGNTHGFIYGFVKPWLVRAGLVAAPRQAFLMSDSTRFVGFDPLTDDKLIHEFPAYAFYVGDLHAHLSNLPWVLLLACVLLAWLRARGASGAPAARGWLLVAAWQVGLFAVTNAWDALMYATVLGALLLAHLAAALRTGRDSAGAAVADGLWAGGAMLATALPFLVHFHAHGEGFFPTHSHTPVWQWLILYGLQSLLAIAGCIVGWRPGSELLAAPERRMLVVLTAFGIAFALVPEFAYLKDIYGSIYYRGNTAFKFGFQAFTLLTLAACVGVALLLSGRRRFLPQTAVVILLECALVPPLYYSWFVLQGGFGVWPEREWTLDGQRYFALNYPEDRAATNWLVQHVPAGGRIIEAVGDSFTYASRISTNTGIPTVIGWNVHELLWRGSEAEVSRRRDDVAALYEGKSQDDARRVIARYRARWLVVGRFEREQYPKLDVGFVRSLGRVVFVAGETFIVDLGSDRQP